MKKRARYSTKLCEMLRNKEITLDEMAQLLNKHEKKLEKRRKYKCGDLITSIDELLSQEFVFVLGGIKHIEFVKSLQFRSVIDLIDRKSIWKAIKK